MKARMNMAGKNGAQLIADERQRQINREGYDPEHDSQHSDGEIVCAAYAYLYDLIYRHRRLRAEWPPRKWPWDYQDWKPTPDDPVRQLVKVGALIAAEIDRLQHEIWANDAKERV